MSEEAGEAFKNWGEDVGEPMRIEELPESEKEKDLCQIIVETIMNASLPNGDEKALCASEIIFKDLVPEHGWKKVKEAMITLLRTSGKPLVVYQELADLYWIALEKGLCSKNERTIGRLLKKKLGENYFNFPWV